MPRLIQTEWLTSWVKETVMHKDKPDIVFLIKSAPAGSQANQAAVDTMLTAAAFERNIVVVFMDDGLYQLLATKDLAAPSNKSVSKSLPALSLYDIDKVYSHKPSQQRLGLEADQFVISVESIENEALKQLVADAEQVMVF